MQTISEWVNYLEELNPHHIKLGLDRIQKIAAELDLNHFNIPVVTVTGTNGKGSCVAFLEAIYLANGYRVGCYTSPHLLRFNERVRINGQDISDDNLIKGFAEIYAIKQDIFLTYFEFTTLAALKIFKESNLDVLILEVGLGGRLDATNIVENDLAIISTVGLDHCDRLGNTREQIGWEKAGIFRASKWAVCGDPEPPHTILDHAKKLATRLYLAGINFNYGSKEKGWWWKFQDHIFNFSSLPALDLQNASTALAAVYLLQNVLPVSNLEIGLQKANLPGRFQKIGNTIFDVGHNPHAANWLAKKLQQESCEGRTLAVIGMMADKDIGGFIAALNDQIDAWYWGELPGPRGAKIEQILQLLQQIRVKKWYNSASVLEAYKAAKAVCTNKDRMIVLGSFSTVSECLMF